MTKKMVLVLSLVIGSCLTLSRSATGHTRNPSPDMPEEICTLYPEKAKALRQKFPTAMVPYEYPGETLSEAQKQIAVRNGFLAISRLPDAYLNELFGKQQIKVHISPQYWGGGSAGESEVYTTGFSVVHELGHIFINHFIQDQATGAQFYEDLKKTFNDAKALKWIIIDWHERYPGSEAFMESYFRSLDDEYFAECLSVYYCGEKYREQINPITRAFLDKYFTP